MSVDGFYEMQEDQQRVKTRIVSDYFWAWKTIMLRNSSGDIAYIDLFAGRGRFDDGTESTPLHILGHVLEDERLQRRLVTLFNDRNSEYIEALRGEIERLPGIEALKHTPVLTTFEVGSEMVSRLGEMSRMPALFFVDPWGYKGLSLDLIGSAISRWGSECIFYFNYNRVNPSISNTKVSERMDELFVQLAQHVCASW